MACYTIAMIKAAIFDMDGLMIDSNPIISRAYEEVLRECGVDKPTYNMQGIVHTPGISAKANWSRLVNKYGITVDIEQLAHKKNRIQTKLIKEGVVAMPGLFSLLTLLSEHGVVMAIASSSKREIILEVTRQLNISRYFSVIVAGDEVSHGKPSPDIFLLAATKLSLKPDDCVVFEDAIDGVRAAKSAGMACIAISAIENLNDPDFSVANLVETSLEHITWSSIENIALH